MKNLSTNNYILVTGGMGYLGSLTVIKLLKKNYQVIIIDNLVNSTRMILDQIFKISGKVPIFYEGDIRDPNFLDQIFTHYKIFSVIHFAGLKEVSESLKNPIKYFSNNVTGSITLFEVMKKNKVNNIIFSSTANVYGNPISTPISEDHPVNPNNPYGKSKWVIEEILRTLQCADPKWKIIILRYFNPLGAHTSGLIGEPSSKNKTNIMPVLCDAAYTNKFPIPIYGNDYLTEDGTPVRDFIHVEDLTSGHIAALEFLINSQKLSEPLIINLGTGKPTTVLQLINTFSEITGIDIPFEFKARRKGDISISYTNPEKAHKVLSWKANKGIREMCEDAWRWKQNEALK